jgi:plasmid stabilization system protein ParE
MPTAYYTPEADQDLIRIGTYIAADNPAAALRWTEAMQGVCDLLAGQTGIGQRVETNRFGEVRRHVVGNYLVYYRPFAGGVEILAVVHGSREQGRLV